MKIFALRIDLDTRKCIRDGLPKLLELLKELDVKASFYVPIGGESNFFEIIENRGGVYEKGISKLSFFEKVLTVLMPQDFLKKYKKLLMRIIDDGHELGVHGWKHREWTHSLEKLDLNCVFSKIVSGYEKLTSKRPASFAAPGLNTNANVLKALDRFGFLVASDLPGEKPFRPIADGVKFKHVQVPVNIRKGSLPIIEYYTLQGLSDKDIVKAVCRDISGKNYAVMYGHGTLEGSQKINVLRDILKYVKKQKYNIMTIENIAKYYLEKKLV